MATFKYQDKEVRVAENWRVGEQIEAENALKLDLESATSGGRLAIVLFISIRREDKQTPIHILADQVMRMELANLLEEEEVEQAGPLVEPDAEKDSAIDAPLISGRQPSDSLA